MKIAITAAPATGRLAPIVLRGDMGKAFALAARLCYHGVEIHVRNPADIDRATIKQLMERHDLGVPTLGTGMAAGMDGLTFADPDKSIRQRAMARIDGHIALASELGSAVTIGLIWGRVTNDPATQPEHIAIASECLAQCCVRAKALGVTLLLEAINRYESDYPVTLHQAINIVKPIGLPNLRILADTYHMNIEETDMAAALRRAGSLLGHIHLVDSNRQAPGHGHMDLRSLVQTLHEIGYSGYLSFEVQPMPSPEQAAADGIAAVAGFPGVDALQRI
jgi:sugar phosphate isomerase/epimerase